MWCSFKSLEGERICSRPRKFKAVVSGSGSCSYAFKNRRLWVDRTRGSFSWSSCGCQSQLGFWKALCSIPFGSSFVVNSPEDPADWTAAVQKLWSKERKCRLEEVKILRDSYGRKYNWEEQMKELVNKMISWAHGMNVNYGFFSTL